MLPDCLQIKLHNLEKLLNERKLAADDTPPITQMDLANLTAELQLVTASTTTTYQIVRQGRSGPTVLAAQETSALRPGDVLKVKLTTTRQPRDNAIGVGQQTSLQKGHQTLR